MKKMARNDKIKKNIFFLLPLILNLFFFKASSSMTKRFNFLFMFYGANQVQPIYRASLEVMTRDFKSWRRAYKKSGKISEWYNRFLISATVLFTTKKTDRYSFMIISQDTTHTQKCRWSSSIFFSFWSFPAGTGQILTA